MGKKKRGQNSPDYETIFKFLDEHGVVDKDSGSEKKSSSRTCSRKKANTHSIPTTRLDLHGKTRERAALAIKWEIERCLSGGVKKLIIIHGWGQHTKNDETPVLKSLVTNLLSTQHRAQISHFRPAAPREGGVGATVVFF